MYLWLAAALFAAFVANVAHGAATARPVLGDVGEMLVLLAASIAFTIAVLRREAAARAAPKGGQDGP